MGLFYLFGVSPMGARSERTSAESHKLRFDVWRCVFMLEAPLDWQRSGAYQFLCSLFCTSAFTYSASICVPVLNTHPHQQAWIPAQSEAPSGSGWLFPNPLPAAWRMTFNHVYQAYLHPFCLSEVCLSFTEIVMNHQPPPKKGWFANRATVIISRNPTA